MTADPLIETADHAFLGGRLILREVRTGHRSGTDAVLLAAAAYPEIGAHVLDAGAGAGAAALAILARNQGVSATLLERDAAMVELSRHNIAANGFGDRAEAVELDLFDAAACHAVLPRADVVVSNPPFYLAKTVRASPNPQRASSHVLDRYGHGAWLRRLLALATPGGEVVVIHRPDALPALLAQAENRASVHIRPVHPRAGALASRILLTARLGSRAPAEIAPPVILHAEDGCFTQEVEELHRGGGRIGP